jgi:hypothetical protein
MFTYLLLILNNPFLIIILNMYLNSIFFVEDQHLNFEYILYSPFHYPISFKLYQNSLKIIIIKHFLEHVSL